MNEGKNGELHVETILIKKEIPKSNRKNTLLISTRHNVIFYNNYLFKRVPDIEQGTRLLQLLFSIGN